MSRERTVTIAADYQRPLNALDAVARDLIHLIAGPSVSSAEPDKMARLAVEAATPETLVAGLINDLCAMADQFDATPTTISLDGFRVLADGYRAWGVVGLSYGGVDRDTSPVRLGTPTVTRGDDTWSISVPISIT